MLAYNVCLLYGIRFVDSDRRVVVIGSKFGVRLVIVMALGVLFVCRGRVLQLECCLKDCVALGANFSLVKRVL